MALLMPVCFTFLLAGAALAAELHPLSDEFISLINSKQSSWTAGRNFPPDTPLSQLKKLMGVIDPVSPAGMPVKFLADVGDLPVNFDCREKWPNCPSLNEIRDQGCCGSDWAFGAVEAMTDRVCTFSNGTKNFHFSADDVMTCCTDWCVGCEGGYPGRAWNYWRDTGIVSGGPFNSSQGCRPYEISSQCPNGHVSDTPTCNQTCEPGYNVEYEKDKHRGKSVYLIKDVNVIMKELYDNGPVEAVMEAFEDFLHYKTGVYSHEEGESMGHHAVKILGWGLEDGKQYWLCANSWGANWGKEGGFFKIVRGQNECSIEDAGVLAGEPDLSGL